MTPLSLREAARPARLARRARWRQAFPLRCGPWSRRGAPPSRTTGHRSAGSIRSWPRAARRRPGRGSSPVVVLHRSWRTHAGRPNEARHLTHRDGEGEGADDHGVEADDLARRVGERAAGVATREPDIGLDPRAAAGPHRADGVDDAHGERSTNAQGMAHGGHERAHGSRVADGGGGYARAQDAEQGKISIRVTRDHLTLEAAAIDQSYG